MPRTPPRRRNGDEPKASGGKEKGEAELRHQSSSKHNPIPKGRPVRLYADGIFDLFHFGHARALEQCKRFLLPDSEVYLIVGCCNDRDTNKHKGLTVMTEDERYESLRHCKWVDEVVKDAPWTINDEFLKKHKIDFVCHDPIPYTGEGTGDVYAEIKAKGMFLETQRTEGVSTTGLITRVIRKYDDFVKRNQARGKTLQDMNVSFLKKSDLIVAEQMKKFADQWPQTASLVHSFTQLFDRNSEIRTSFRAQRKAIRDEIEKTTQGVINSIIDYAS